MVLTAVKRKLECCIKVGFRDDIRVKNVISYDTELS